MKMLKIPLSSFWVSTGFILVSLAIWSCAAEGTAGGGPLDETGPRVMEINPNPDKTILTGKETVTVRFDELVDPLSIPASVSVNPDIPVKVKTRGKQVEIRPDSSWPENATIQISLSRNIRDYQSNRMADQTELFYSTGGKFPQNKISGTVFNFTEGMVAVAGLFRVNRDSAPEMVRKTEANDTGQFVFHHVPDGRFFIACVEGEMTDLSKDIRTKRYGFQSMNPVLVQNDSEINDVAIWMDGPVKQLTIQSIHLTNREYGNLEMSDGSTIPYTFSMPENADPAIPLYVQRKPLEPGDSVMVRIFLQNRLERYQLPPYNFIIPDLRDTIPPQVSSSGYEEEQFYITFSEPVIPLVPDSILVFSPDSTTHHTIDYRFSAPEKIQVEFIPEVATVMSLNLSKLQDYFGNSFTDTIITFTMNPVQKEKETTEGGSIKGTIDYHGVDSLLVVATRTEDGTRYFTNARTDFYFQNIQDL